MHKSVWLTLSISMVITACGVDLPEEVASAKAGLPDRLDYNIHVKPVLSDKCFACHGLDVAKRKAELALHQAEGAYARHPEFGRRAIVPGQPGKSELVRRILSNDPEIQMPNPESKLQLSPYEKAVLVQWIEEGAEYKDHWAFLQPQSTVPPKIQESSWVKNPIDQFVRKRLEQAGLDPAPEADKATLLRRLSLDLTGLPPSLEEIQNFVQDTSPDAYEKQVDRLLASPHYGEKMATDWLDLARYADTHGYTVDRYRDVSPYRDWVIKSFNQNQAYDEFILWQMAGDLLPNPTRDQLIATAFNRMHPQNMEGGIVPEEFRVEYVSDRVNTLGTGLLAMTFECAKCHDHKYDPVSQKEYYELFSFFNNVNEAGQISWDNAMPVPTLLMTTPAQDSTLAELREVVIAKEQALQEIQTSEKEAIEQWLMNRETEASTSFPDGIIAYYPLNNNQLENQRNRANKGQMKRVSSNEEVPNLVEGHRGQGLELDGDAWLDLTPIGAFDRTQPFTVGIWVYLPEDLKDGVIFHKGDGAALYNFRGYHLALKDGKLEILLAHTLPDNAVVEYADAELPRKQWIQLSMRHDGSGTAKGLDVFLNGEQLPTTVHNDKLIKDILFNREKEPGLQIGARWRGKGIGGARVDDITVFDRQLSRLEILQLADPEKANALLGKKANYTPEERGLLEEYYLKTYSKNSIAAGTTLQEARRQLQDSIEPIQEMMIIQEMSERRPAYVLQRGQYNEYGEEVFPNTPERILAMPEDLPRNRLGLAQWLVHPDNPLTSRVAVNRYWQNYFGRGLVKTTEDFGNQGELPSHPELLDWLAVRFRESGWDVKGLQKMIVLSATYRQSSISTPEKRERDPENILLARGPSGRLSAEMLRDNALAASGLLYPEIGGKSVKPYQPKDLWKVNGGQYEESEAPQLYRRSLYTFWKRSIPHPTQATFDAGTRSSCSVRRQKTNTPLQALVLLNDPVFVETSRALGEQMTKATELEIGIKEVFTGLTGRPPSNQELDLLKKLQQQTLSKFQRSPEKTEGWLTTGVYRVASDLPRELLAANTLVASTILNSDATIVKR